MIIIMKQIILKYSFVQIHCIHTRESGIIEIEILGENLITIFTAQKTPLTGQLGKGEWSSLVKIYSSKGSNLNRNNGERFNESTMMVIIWF